MIPPPVSVEVGQTSPFCCGAIATPIHQILPRLQNFQSPIRPFFGLRHCLKSEELLLINDTVEMGHLAHHPLQTEKRDENTAVHKQSGKIWQYIDLVHLTHLYLAT